MKRSDINNAIRHALALLETHGMALPRFAYWKTADWRANADQLDVIRAVGLGWDVTDFGSGDFEKTGSVLFTVRNGRRDESGALTGTPYAEKLIFQQCAREQEIPFHFHRVKTEDIINRGGGVLAIQLYNAAPDGGLDMHSEVRAALDGELRVLPAGSVLEIEKGGSITLTPGLHHRFWAKQGAGDLIAGEVSSLNDDHADNFFLQNVRFSQIVEDEPPLTPLCNEYHRWVMGSR